MDKERRRMLPLQDRYACEPKTLGEKRFLIRTALKAAVGLRS